VVLALKAGKKFCRGCQKSLPVRCFSVARSNRSGRQSRCKSCVAVAVSKRTGGKQRYSGYATQIKVAVYIVERYLIGWAVYRWGPLDVWPGKLVAAFVSESDAERVGRMLACGIPKDTFDDDH